MADYQRELSIGEQQLVRRGTEPPDGWRTRTTIHLEADETALLTGGRMPTRRRPRGNGGPTPPPEPPPDPPPTGAVQGYARVWMLANGRSGGSASVDDIHTPAGDATVYPCSTFAQLRSALLASGKRFIRVTGSANLDGGGLTTKITNPHFTVDFSAHTGEVRNIKLFQVACDDSIWTEGAIRTREGSTGTASADRRNITFNPGSGGVLHGHCLDHMSLAWGPDVIGSILNHCTDITIQYCLIGPALLNSNNIKENPNGYGFNMTVPGNNFSQRLTEHAERVTFYRNLSAINRQRNMKTEHVEGYDGVCNVVFDFNQAPCYGNPIGANYINNIFKKGPESKAPTNTDAFEEDGGTGDLYYPQYDDSTYHSGNIGLKADGSGYTLDWSRIDASALRATPYDGGPTDAAHGPLTVDTADATLFAAVVAEAGRTYQDAVDTFVKASATAGTSDGYYNGAGFSAPHPFNP